MKRTRGASNNVLLQKDDVGRPKPNTRKLPPDTFTFGKKEIRDIEDAGQGEYRLMLCRFCPFVFVLITLLCSCIEMGLSQNE